MAETRTALHAYRENHPEDAWAKRLASRLHAWIPSLGVPLHESTDAEPARSEDTPVWDAGDTIDPDVPLTMLHTARDDKANAKYRGA
jgi:hypothetical protein